jgi:aryl-alcohol dehydrogenase-like predicted oxidoreductase
MVSEVGYGTWGMGGGVHGWQGSTDGQALAAMDRAVQLGLNFFDTAWIYGRGHSEELLRSLLQQHKDKRLFVATKPPPKDLNWPALRDARINDVYPASHIEEYLYKSLKNLGLESIDLFQFHVWQDHWAGETEWQQKIMSLKEQKLVRGVGISVNTWEPANVIETLRTGLIDAVQVIYNIFEQRPEDELFPFCVENDIALIARVPFDEGSLTGSITLDTKFPPDDWRASYFVEDNLKECVPRVEALKKLVPAQASLAEMALSFILANEAISTVIPGMRKVAHVEANLMLSDGPRLDPSLYQTLKRHRWDRQPTLWSQ